MHLTLRDGGSSEEKSEPGNVLSIQKFQLCQDVLFSSFCSTKDRPTPVISGSKEYIEPQNKIYVDSSTEGAGRAKIKC